MPTEAARMTRVHPSPSTVAAAKARELREAGVRVLAEDLRQVFELNEFPVVQQKTASFGVATYRPNDQAKDIVARADAESAQGAFERCGGR